MAKYNVGDTIIFNSFGRFKKMIIDDELRVQLIG